MFTERSFSLWAMRNLAQFMQNWYNRITDGIPIASLFTGEISGTFLLHPAEDMSADPGSWLTIASGLLTTIGAMLSIVTGAEPTGAANIVAGSQLAITGGVLGMASEDGPEEVRFNDFSNLEASLGNTSLVVGDMLGGYHD